MFFCFECVEIYFLIFFFMNVLLFRLVKKDDFKYEFIEVSCQVGLSLFGLWCIRVFFLFFNDDDVG